MRVGGLGVVDVADTGHLGDRGGAVRGKVGPAQPVPHRLGRHAERAGERGRGQGVRHHVLGHGAAGQAREVLDAGELGRRSVAFGDERAVDEQVLDHAEVTLCRGTEPEADRPAAFDDVRLPDHLLGDGVGEVVHARHPGPFVDPGLGVPVRRGAAVPVQVVGRQVEAHRGVRRHGPHQVQLEAGQLDGQHVVTREAVGAHVAHDVDQGGPDVAGGPGPQPGRPQHLPQQLDGGRLPVGPGDDQPRRPEDAALEPPGELHLAPHRQVGGLGRDEHGVRRSPAGRGDEQVRAVDQVGRVRAGGRPTHDQVRPEKVEQAGPLRGGAAGDERRVVDDRDLRTALEQGVGGREPRQPQPGHRGAQAAEVAGQPVDPGRGRGAHEPATHSA